MLLNSASLEALRVGFKTNFQDGLGMAPAQWDRIATLVPSGSGSEKYGFLGEADNVREWIGDRHVKGLSEFDYEIKNKDFELTIGVQRNAIRDDNLGQYAMRFRQMGKATAAFPNQQCFGLLKDGFTKKGYDGQFFFDTDHPVLDADGNEISVANTDGGAGTGWYLIDTSQVLKPIIYQEREPFDFVAMDAPTDQNVFMRKKFIYGVDGRSNVGYGFWQFAWGSKQTLNKANYKIAREALMGMKGDYDRPLGVNGPFILLTPPSLENEGLEIVNAERDAAGATNVYKGTAELVVSPWLA